MTAFIFDATKVEPDQGRVGAVPKGWYKTVVEKTELKPTEGGNGQYIAVMFGIIEGPYTGSKFFNNFNVAHATSEKAVEIGHKQFSALLHAVGVMQMTDTDQIKGIPFFTRLKHVAAEMDPQDPTKVKYEEKNEPSAYRNINDQAASEAIKAQATAGVGQAAKPATPPAAMAPPPQQQTQWAPPPQQQQAPQQPAYQPPQQQQMQQQAPVQQQQQWQPPTQQQPWSDPNAQPQQQAPVQQQQQMQQQPPQQQQQAPNQPPPWQQPQQ